MHPESFMKRLGRIFLLLVFAGMQSCNLINPAEPVPAYIKIDTTYITSDYNNQGTASHHITDSWVYVETALQGGYGLPTNFPVLNANGNVTVNIRPGVELDGLSAQHVIYPFYQTYDTVVNLQPGIVTTIIPRTTYISGAIFPWIEDFDDGSFSFERNSNSDTALFATSTNAFEGAQSGVFYLSSTRLTCEYQTYDKYTLPKNKINVIELNYNSENTMEVGLLKVNSDQTTTKLPIIVLKPSLKWNKIYLDLSPTINTQTIQPLGYKVYFKIGRAHV